LLRLLSKDRVDEDDSRTLVMRWRGQRDADVEGVVLE